MATEYAKVYYTVGIGRDGIVHIDLSKEAIAANPAADLWVRMSPSEVRKFAIRLMLVAEIVDIDELAKKL